jgi:hypothetical protein
MRIGKKEDYKVFSIGGCHETIYRTQAKLVIYFHHLALEEKGR